jgi:hypothetical protein
MTLSLVFLLTVASVSATSIDVFSVENSETKENLHSVSVNKNATFSINSSGVQSIIVGDPEVSPVTFYDLTFWNTKSVGPQVISFRKLHQLTDFNILSLRKASIKKLIYPFHSHW